MYMIAHISLSQFVKDFRKVFAQVGVVRKFALYYKYPNTYYIEKRKYHIQ